MKCYCDMEVNVEKLNAAVYMAGASIHFNGGKFNPAGDDAQARELIHTYGLKLSACEWGVVSTFGGFAAIHKDWKISACLVFFAYQSADSEDIV